MSFDLHVQNRLEQTPNTFEYLDIDYDSEGDMVKSENTALLVQSVKKILLTAIGEDKSFLTYGSSIPAIIGSRQNTITVPALRKSVTDALRRLQRIQFQQIQVQDLALEEILNSITDILIDEPEPEQIRIQVTVKNAVGEEVILEV